MTDAEYHQRLEDLTRYLERFHFRHGTLAGLGRDNAKDLAEGLILYQLVEKKHPDPYLNGYVEIGRDIAKSFRRIAEAAERPCSHIWKEARNGMIAVYHNGTNSYMQCELCGKKQRC